MNEIYGWFDFQNIYELAVNEAKDGDTLIELGSFFGKSTSFMGNAIKQSGKDLAFYAVDSWKGAPPNAKGTDDTWIRDKILETDSSGSVLYHFIKNMKEREVLEYIKPICFDSSKASRLFEDRSVSFVFIDACHEYDFVIKDITSWLPKVRNGGTMGGHDEWMPGVRKAVQEVFGENYIKNGTSWLVKVG